MKILRAIKEVIILIIKGLYLILGSIIIIPIAVTIVIVKILYDKVKATMSYKTSNKKSDNEDSKG